MRPHLRILILSAAFLTGGGFEAGAQTAMTPTHDAVGDGPLTQGDGPLTARSGTGGLGTGMTGAVPNDAGTHASGALNGNAAVNDSPVAGTGNLGSGSATSGNDPMNGSNNLDGPAIPTGSLSNTSH